MNEQTQLDRIEAKLDALSPDNVPRTSYRPAPPIDPAVLDAIEHMARYAWDRGWPYDQADIVRAWLAEMRRREQEASP